MAVGLGLVFVLVGVALRSAVGTVGTAATADEAGPEPAQQPIA